MTKVQIWHNPRCSKSRQGLQYLTDQKCEVSVFDYTKGEIDPEELVRVIEMSDHPLADFVRANEPEFKELGLDLKSLTVREFARLAAKHPKLLQRPIVIKAGKAIIARPASIIHELLK